MRTCSSMSLGPWYERPSPTAANPTAMRPSSSASAPIEAAKLPHASQFRRDIHGMRAAAGALACSGFVAPGDLLQASHDGARHEAAARAVDVAIAHPRLLRHVILEDRKST